MPDKPFVFLTGGVVGLGDLVVGRDVVVAPRGRGGVALTAAQPVMVVRREDFLFLTFVFSGLGLKDKGKAEPTLVRTDAEALITVAFPQQSIAEQAFYQIDKGGPQPDPNKPPGQSPPAPAESEQLTFPATARLSGISWLTFRIPDKIKSIPYTLEALLDWGRWELQVTAPKGVPQNGLLASAIEAPHRLLLSPQPDAGWEHLRAPAERDGGVELWHTRLVRPPARKKSGVELRVSNPVPSVWAAWARDFDPGDTKFQSPFRTSLSPRQRTELVLLSSTSKSKTPVEKGFTPTPIAAHRLMLTSLGAYLDLRGDWGDEYRGELNKVLDTLDVESDVSVSQWRHAATLGRDHYVKIVEEGSLFPFGHRAALVTITERRFHGRAVDVTAALLQRMFVVVREPVREMRAPGTAAGNLIDSLLPFTRVRINNPSTPVIDPPEKSQVGKLGVKGFWIRVNGQDFRFSLVGDDWEGRPCEFDLPLVFVSDAVVNDKKATDEVINAYNLNAFASDKKLAARTLAQTYGQTLAFAPTDADSAGRTSYETRTLTFKALAADQSDKQRYRASLLKAEARVSAIEQLVGGAATFVELRYAKPYLTSGIEGGNEAEVFAELVTAPSLSFNDRADRAGGVATPSMRVSGLSRRLGAVGGASGPGDVANLAQGKFDPSLYFDFNSAKILGGISLSAILPAMGPALPSKFDADRLPKLNTRPVFADGGETPTALETTLDWKPRLKGDHPVLQFDLPGEGLTLSVRMLTSLRGEPDVFSIFGELKFFRLNFADAIQLAFDSLTFSQPAGQKMDLSAALPDPSKPPKEPVPPRRCVTFGGPLAFLNQLAALIDPAGFVDPPSLDVSASGARLGYTVGLPPLTVGAYALQNVTLGAALNIPFSGEPVRVRFNFCERHAPFLLTVSGFAGGGFVGLALGADGIESIESALEFGGNVALNLGVASGGVRVMGGFYFGSSQNALTFTAYVRANGVLEVLSLVAISTEFYLGLSYSKIGNSGRFWGQASVTVEVDVGFFSKSVSMTVEREFAGGDNDPTFQQLMSQSQYQDYRAAFAD